MPPPAIQPSFQLAIQHHQAGRLQEAEQLYRQILVQQPDHSDALQLLGVIASQAGRPEDAVDLIRRSISLKPDFFIAHFHLGNALRDSGRVDEAIDAYRQSIALHPNNPQALYILGNALRSRKRFDESIAAYRQAITLKPNYSEAHNNLGIALAEKGLLDEAMPAFQTAIALKPDNAQAHNNLAHVLKNAGQLDEAIAAYRQAVALQPNYAEALGNLGNILKDIGRLDEAITACRQALVLQPANPFLHGLLVYAHYFHHGDAPTIFQESLEWNTVHAQPLQPLIQPHRNLPDPNRRLKIGYVSPDLREHSVTFFLLPLLESHDHAQFHVTCYFNYPRADHVTERIKSIVDDWRDIVGLPDASVADMIRNDQIDILIDLTGHTAHGRLLTFAQKPAPLQVAYLGFPGTTGLQAMDYQISDPLADPPGLTDPFFTEKILRLPRTAWCFTPLSGSPPLTPSPALANGSITFGSFNNFAKISPQLLELWTQLLHRVPTSRILLKNAAMASAAATAELRRFFAARNIDPARLDLISREPAFQEHLKIYQRIDISLDTYPYHGTTTTCESLWMGVPVITLAGTTHASRVGVSLLTNVGLPELIAESDDQYIALATTLANDLPRLTQLRTTLRNRMQSSPLMDAQSFAQDIESAYRQMWQSWCST